MASSTGAVVLLVVLAVAMVATFVALWVRDRGRAEEQAHDVERIVPAPPADPSDASKPDGVSDARGSGPPGPR